MRRKRPTLATLTRYGDPDKYCLDEKRIQVKAWLAQVHNCKLEKGHTGRHRCIVVASTDKRCSMKWNQKKRPRLRKPKKGKR